ncbi:MAG TPA: sulfurtransferase [Burkholderiaceae bacterium]|nr:sulfurtransferase [Burkholderiaceae bacterium]
MNSSVLNVSAYKFVSLDDPARWRERIRAQAEAHALKGTVLLAHEGINLFLAGHAEALRRFVTWLREHGELADLEAKESWSTAAPFRRLLVKVKREIIRMNCPTIRPQAERAPAVDAPTLARWLAAGHDDAGRPVVTLDTRNAFEIGHGRFRGALDWGLARFSDFPQALQRRRAELEGKTVVSYCTGGIRCEKAALLMREAGVENVLQLDGGILRYFEQAGGQHFDGSCFVFDQRESLDVTLTPAQSV